MRSLLFLPLLFGLSGPAIADAEVFKIDVSAESYRNYILSGTDRNGSVSGEDPTVTLNKGDTIIFDVDASRHPFYIKTCLLYTSPSPRDGLLSRMPSSA